MFSVVTLSEISDYCCYLSHGWTGKCCVCEFFADKLCQSKRNCSLNDTNSLFIYLSLIFFFNGLSYALASAHSDGGWNLFVEVWRQLPFSK